jgi:hypothetical protein
MKNNNTLIKIALIGLVLAVSGCSLGVNALVDDTHPGQTTVFGNAGGDQDREPGNRGRTDPPNDEICLPDPGPGNSDFGRGKHPNAGGGNGSEFDDDGNDIDPGNSGDSNGNSDCQD